MNVFQKIGLGVIGVLLLFVVIGVALEIPLF
jgi:hypothetical protein